MLNNGGLRPEFSRLNAKYGSDETKYGHQVKALKNSLNNAQSSKDDTETHHPAAAFINEQFQLATNPIQNLAPPKPPSINEIHQSTPSTTLSPIAHPEALQTSLFSHSPVRTSSLEPHEQ